MSDFDMENATAVELVHEILRITGVERWEALTKILKPPTDEVERDKADKMIVKHIHNIARVDDYLDKLKDIFKKAAARKALELEQKGEEPEIAAPPKKHYGNKKNRKNK